MPNVPPHNAIHRGTNVSIILKADQSTGRQVGGSVADVLTRGNHPRGVKVRLSDGRVGRVQAIMSNNPYNQQYNPPPNQQYNASYNNNDGGGYNSQYGHGSGGYGQGVPAPYTGGYTPQPHRPSNAPMNQQPQRNNEEENLVDPAERTEQLEYFESYENARAPTKEERDRSLLQQEFKGVDGSLVAAIYGDCDGDLSACREMLQAIQ